MDDTETEDAIWAHRKDAADLTNTALSHYAVHRQIVLRKLELAKKATKNYKRQKARAEAQGFWAKYKAVVCGCWPFQKRTDDLWSEIIALFSVKVVSEEGLFLIEELLEKMPKETYEVFSHLLTEDKNLGKLEKGLNREEYNEAKAKITDVQNHENPLTGLTSEDYETGFLEYLRDVLFDELE